MVEEDRGRGGEWSPLAFVLPHSLARRISLAPVKVCTLWWIHSVIITKDGEPFLPLLESDTWYLAQTHTQTDTKCKGKSPVENSRFHLSLVEFIKLLNF